MNINSACILEDRGILFIDGVDAKDFLQNIITNDINKVSDHNSCFASLLNPQGKFLFEFLVIQHKKGYFIDCEKNQINELFKQLSLYKLRSSVQILNLSNEFVVAALSYEKFKSMEGSKDQLGFTLKYREDPILLDPRNKKLGARLVINLEKLYLSLKKLDLKSTKQEEYYNLSFELGIAQQNTDKLKNKIFGIECNFDELNAIDFKKGCYIGQENTSRIKLKNKLTKRLLPIKVIEGDISAGQSIFIEKTEIGKVLIDKNYPFAVIKHTSEKFNFDLIFKINNATIRIIKPKWLNLN
ncbi:MAG: folate-binding protein YgfZ [Pelagibacterales bacterium]|nr:folate-binding protein YgfZ [Pelagibacterales bacterium]